VGCHHRCRSKHIFGGAKEFCPNFPKLARPETFCAPRPEKDAETTNEVFSFSSGAIFLEKEVTKYVSEFSGILSEYAKSKLLAVRLHPMHLQPWASAEIFPGEGRVDMLLVFFGLLAMQREWTYTKRKMSNVTATVTYSVFHIRTFCTEKMFVLVRMDISSLSWQSSK